MITKRISFALATAASLLAAAAALKYAQALDIVGPETARRTVQVIIGLVLAVYGNFMPKDVVRSRVSGRAIARSQSALRVGGWSMTLAGLAHAALWAFAPLVYADVISMVVVASAVVVTVGYGGWSFLACRAERSPSI